MDFVTRVVGSGVRSGASKSLVSLSDFDAWMDAQIDARLSGAGGLQSAYQGVPWIFRGVKLRCNALASMPLDVLKGDTVVDSSGDWQNVVGCIPNINRLLWQIEAALTVFGSAYLYREANRVKTVGLRFLNPQTITPRIDAAAGLTGFTRKIGAQQIELTPEQLIYFWEYDPFVELGPAVTSPALSAMKAANTLTSFDDFVQMFFERGAVKATLLTMSGNPPPAEKERIKTWWRRFMSGLRNAFSAEVVNADGVTPVVVGEGVSELNNKELTDAKREDIAVALGVPQTLLFSNAANYATAKQDDLHFYTKTIMPEAEFIAAVLNEQLFAPMGYRIVFRPETLEVFQQDENDRANALAALVNALGEENRGVALQMLGFDLPEGYEYEDFNSDPADDPATMPPDVVTTPPDSAALQQAKAKERKQFRAWQKNANGRVFQFKFLDADEQADLRESVRA